jgi:hypothetical protein
MYQFLSVELSFCTCAPTMVAPLQSATEQEGVPDPPPYLGG